MAQHLAAAQKCRNSSGEAAYRKAPAAWLPAFLGALLAALTLGVVPGQVGRKNQPLIQDWSNKHLIFTAGKSPVSILSPTIDPRLWNTWLERNLVLFQPVRTPPRLSPIPGRKPQPKFKTDWAVPLNSSSGVDPGTFPAKFTFDVGLPPSCTADFVVFPINANASNQANIVAFNQLYRGPDNTGMCQTPPGSTPNTMWAYQVGSGGVRTSPVLSYPDADQVAFVESQGNASVFHVLTWKSGEGSITSPKIPGANGSQAVLRSVRYDNWGSAPAATNTRSSPFVDYGENAAYVGADNGYLYKIKPVFGLGTPQVVASRLVTSSPATLTGAVRDPLTGLVFVSDGQYVKAYDSNLASKGQLFVSYSSTGIADPPILDVTNHFVYVFSNNNPGHGKAVTVQVPYSAPPSVFGTAVFAEIGGQIGTPIRSGAFDNGYYGAPGSGALYVCGNQGPSPGSSSLPALYKFTFQSITGTMNPAPALKNINISPWGGECSPLTEFFNVNDRLFLSHSGVQQVQMWELPVVSESGNKKASYEVANGTCGIIVDNISAEAQASSIYFSTRDQSSGKCMVSGWSKVCAVKLTQAGLQ